MNKRIRKKISIFTIVGLLATVGFAEAMYQQRELGGYNYSQGLTSKRSGISSTYTGAADTKWTKPSSKVTAQVSGKNSNDTDIIVGSKQTGNKGYAVCSLSVDTKKKPDVKVWKSHHQAINLSTGSAYGDTTVVFVESVK